MLTTSIETLTLENEQFVNEIDQIGVQMVNQEELKQARECQSDLKRQMQEMNSLSTKMDHSMTMNANKLTMIQTQSFANVGTNMNLPVLEYQLKQILNDNSMKKETYKKYIEKIETIETNVKQSRTNITQNQQEKEELFLNEMKSKTNLLQSHCSLNKQNIQNILNELIEMKKDLNHFKNTKINLSHSKQYVERLYKQQSFTSDILSEYSKQNIDKIEPFNVKKAYNEFNTKYFLKISNLKNEMKQATKQVNQIKQRLDGGGKGDGNGNDDDDSLNSSIKSHEEKLKQLGNIILKHDKQIETYKSELHHKKERKLTFEQRLKNNETQKQELLTQAKSIKSEYQTNVQQMKLDHNWAMEQRYVNLNDKHKSNVNIKILTYI